MAIEKKSCDLMYSIGGSPHLKFMKKIPNYKALFDVLVFSPLSMPSCLSCRREIKKKEKFESPQELMDFASGCCNSFIKPSQVREEIGGLLSLLGEQPPKNVLEIGTANGGTLFLFCNSSTPDATIISLDFGGYSSAQGWLYKSFAKKAQNLHLLRGDSHNAQSLEKIKSILKGNPLDFLFIDGDHSYEGVKKDFEMYSPLVRKGGIIAFHDVVVHPPELRCEVSRFWEELKQTHNTKELVKDKAQGWAGIGVVIA
ncbi:Methyltransferase domain protein [Candidatus Anstonella stagnisolia]|nr:Methyltransferase domain protein [Candidatus Anstonella stagnisolia]